MSSFTNDPIKYNNDIVKSRQDCFSKGYMAGCIGELACIYCGCINSGTCFCAGIFTCQNCKKENDIFNIKSLNNSLRDNEKNILRQVDIQLNEISGEFYYKSNRFEIKKSGEEPWNYAVYLDGKIVDKVCGVDISLVAGEAPIISMKVIDR
jgi:hypothetical protein